MIATSGANLIILPLYLHIFTPLVVLGATVKSVGLRSPMIGMNEVLASLNIPQAWDTWVFHEQTKNWNDMQFDTKGIYCEMLMVNQMLCLVGTRFFPIGKSLSRAGWFLELQELANMARKKKWPAGDGGCFPGAVEDIKPLKLLKAL